MSLLLKVLTPERLVLEAEVESVTAVSPDGEFGVLQGHQPMLRPLSQGVLRCSLAGGIGQKRIALMGGVLNTDGQTVTVLTETAELATEIDVLRAEQAKKRAEERLRQRESDMDNHRAEQALKRAITRLKATH